MAENDLNEKFGVVILPCSQDSALDLIDALSVVIQEAPTHDEVIEITFLSEMRALHKFDPHIAYRTLLVIPKIDFISRDSYLDMPKEGELRKMVDEFYREQ
jgi:hypothetical protein